MLEKLDLEEIRGAVEDEGVPDGDSVSQEKVEKAFGQKFYLKTEEAVSLQKSYVLHMHKSGRSLVAGLSGPQVQLYNIGESSLTTIHTRDFDSSEGGICGVRFLNKNSNVFLSGQTAGSIVLHDKREKKSVATLEDTTNGSRKPFTTFDVNSNDRVICVGTEQILHDVFLLFFDVRQRQLLGGYWESHEDDVTSIQFHPSDPDILASGSTDGLINVFKISAASESDALDYSLNTEKTVQRINWHKQEKGSLLSSIMDSHDFHVYTEDSDLLSSFSREDITERMLRKSARDCSTIGSHNSADGMFLMTGSNFQNGECLRILKYREKELHPHANFIGNHQIIRSYIHDEAEDIYITGGENGIISLWTHQQPTIEEKSKAVDRRKSHQTVKPY
ncbi:WD repeat-containing protein 89 [Phlebotomus argentipes]|uniref:WD repeat-containing protein 89 n=1 Tax=Phlebotomus argentipes TaxID=94469 RepID=UPI002893050A|nr:WD repeat-containing protein 89 [Phlebotomus argentipes]